VSKLGFVETEELKRSLIEYLALKSTVSTQNTPIYVDKVGKDEACNSPQTLTESVMSVMDSTSLPGWCSPSGKG
jgi:hypothetical protein